MVHINRKSINEQYDRMCECDSSLIVTILFTIFTIPKIDIYIQVLYYFTILTLYFFLFNVPLVIIHNNNFMRFYKIRKIMKINNKNIINRNLYIFLIDILMFYVYLLMNFNKKTVLFFTIYELLFWNVFVNLYINLKTLISTVPNTILKFMDYF